MNRTDTGNRGQRSPISVYRRVLPSSPGQALVKFRIALPDRPGSLAGLASSIAQADGNISFFHYDRSLDSSRVAVEVQLANEPAVGALLASLQEKKYDVGQTTEKQDDLLVTAPESVLEAKSPAGERAGRAGSLRPAACRTRRQRDLYAV